MAVYSNAYPTIILFFALIAITAINIIVANFNILPYNVHIWNPFLDSQYIVLDLLLLIICFVVATICSYLHFTIAHDASHRAVTENKFYNDIIGSISAMWLGPSGLWEVFKYTHQLHHENTNDENLDPDIWCSNIKQSSKITFIVFRWCTLDLYYLYFTIKNIIKGEVKNKYIIITSSILWESIYVYILYNTFIYGFMWQLLWLWILPSRITILMLAYLFDYLPHSPHITTKQENKYKTTQYLDLPWYLKPFARIILVNQNYHVIHHLYPYVPFYAYSLLWDKKRQFLIEEKDVPIKKIGYLPNLSQIIEMKKMVLEYFDNVNSKKK